MIGDDRDSHVVFASPPVAKNVSRRGPTVSVPSSCRRSSETVDSPVFRKRANRIRWRDVISIPVCFRSSWKGERTWAERGARASSIRPPINIRDTGGAPAVSGYGQQRHRVTPRGLADYWLTYCWPFVRPAVATTITWYSRARDRGGERILLSRRRCLPPVSADEPRVSGPRGTDDGRLRDAPRPRAWRSRGGRSVDAGAAAARRTEEKEEDDARCGRTTGWHPRNSAAMNSPGTKGQKHRGKIITERSRRRRCRQRQRVSWAIAAVAVVAAAVAPSPSHERDDLPLSTSSPPPPETSRDRRRRRAKNGATPRRAGITPTRRHDDNDNVVVVDVVVVVHNWHGCFRCFCCRDFRCLRRRSRRRRRPRRCRRRRGSFFRRRCCRCSCCCLRYCWR